MDRRNFIGNTVTGVAGFTIASQINCGGKSVSGTVTLITGAISELKLLFPAIPALDKIIKLATDFNADWIAGKFDSARTFFDNLDTTVQTVISDLGLNASARVKLLLASVGIGVRVIAALISEQGASQPKAMTAANATAPSTVNRVKQLANAAEAETILKAVMK